MGLGAACPKGSEEGPEARKRKRPAPTEANCAYATLQLFYQWLHKERQE